MFVYYKKAYTYDFTASDGSIQNGGPDGLALCYQGAVVESGGAPVFISYEGTFTAEGGCADGMTTTDIGVAETGDTPAGQSLQLTGGGRTYAALADTWNGPLAETPGAVNDGQALPVELVAFAARADGNAVVLSWKTASEDGNAGFYVHQKRADADGAAFETVTKRIAGHGTTTEAHRYEHRLTGLAPGRYVFQLRQEDTDGAPHVATQTAEAQVGIDGPFQLSAAYPNPFRSRASLDLAVREAQDVRVALYDVRGRRVLEVFDGRVAPEQPETFTLEAGALASGVYLWRVKGETFTETRRVVLAR